MILIITAKVNAAAAGFNIIQTYTIGMASFTQLGKAKGSTVKISLFLGLSITATPYKQYKRGTTSTHTLFTYMYVYMKGTPSWHRTTI